MTLILKVVLDRDKDRLFCSRGSLSMSEREGRSACGYWRLLGFVDGGQWLCEGEMHGLRGWWGSWPTRPPISYDVESRLQTVISNRSCRKLHCRTLSTNTALASLAISA